MSSKGVPDPEHSPEYIRATIVFEASDARIANLKRPITVGDLMILAFVWSVFWFPLQLWYTLISGLSIWLLGQFSGEVISVVSILVIMGIPWYLTAFYVFRLYLRYKDVPLF